MLVPELKVLGSLAGKVASYRLVTPLLGYDVWRTWADFSALRGLLRRRYPGMVVPAIPPKLSGPASLSLCEPRRRLLRLFLVRLGRDERLREDPAALTFLGAADGAWAAHCREAAVGPAGGAEASEAGAAWGRMCRYHAPVDYTLADDGEGPLSPTFWGAPPP